MSEKEVAETAEKEAEFDMSACAAMMERMMGEGGASCGCDPSAFFAELEGETDMDEFFSEMFSAVVAMCGGKE